VHAPPGPTKVGSGQAGGGGAASTQSGGEGSLHDQTPAQEQ